jgi:Domain of unknown function (DUF4440)
MLRRLTRSKIDKGGAHSLYWLANILLAGARGYHHGVRTWKVTLLVTVLFVLGAIIAFRAVKAQMKPAANSEAPRSQDVTQQLQAKLHDFLVGAGKNDSAAHDAFWADDLMYTSAKGIVKTKAEIMQSVREEAAKPPDPNAPTATYDAQNVVLHDFGDFAIINFRLVAHTDDHGKQETAFYRNTGTFARRNGDWKVVAWQATKAEDSQNGNP